MQDERRQAIRVDVRGLSRPEAAAAGELYLALRDLLAKSRSYSRQHPAVQRALDGWIRLLAPFHGAGQPVVFEVHAGRLALNGRVPVDGEPASEHAAVCHRFLVTRGIVNTAYLAGLTAAEMGRFVSLLGDVPEGVERAQGLNNALVGLGVQHVVCNAEFSPNVPTQAAAAAPTQPLPALPADETPDAAADGDPADAETEPHVADVWRLSGAELDEFDLPFDALLDDPALGRFEPAHLFGSRRFLAAVAEDGYRALDRFLRAYLEAALGGYAGRRRSDALLERLGRLDAALEAHGERSERGIMRQRLAALLLDQEPAVLSTFLAAAGKPEQALRAEVLKGLVHADRMAKRVLQDLAFRASKADDAESFLHIVEALEWLIPGRIADGDLEPALAALKMVDHLRVSQHTPLAVRTRATQLLRWLCRPELVDRLLVGMVAGDPDTAHRSRELLLHLGPAAGDLLLAELKRSLNPDVRLAIVELVARLLSQEHTAGGTFTRSFRALLVEIEHAEDHPWYYVRNLLAVIREIRDDRFLDSIARFLDNDDRRVRQEAIVACAELRTPAARRLLRSVADGIEIGTPDALDAVGSALLDEEDFDVVSFLMRVIDESQNLEVRLAAVTRMASFPDPEVVDLLARVLNRKRGLIGRRSHYPDTLREAAARVLRRRGTPAAERALADAPLDPSERVRRAAAEAPEESLSSSSWEG